MSNYYEKYLKYKKKYIELKTQLGGDVKENVYIPYFHSCHLDEMKIVPDNCLLINTSVCGLPVRDTSRILNKLEGLFKFKSPLLLDPIKNKTLLEQELGTRLSIHTPGSTYLNTRFSYSLLIDEDKQYSQACSGLYKFGNGKCINIITSEKEFTKENLLSLYTNSILPTTADIEKIFEDDMLKKLDKDPRVTSKKIIKLNIKQIKTLLKIIYTDTFKEGIITQDQLFDKYPGTYFMFTCRPPCGRKVFDRIDLQRQASMDLEIQDLMDEEFNYFNTYIDSLHTIKDIVKNKDYIKNFLIKLKQHKYFATLKIKLNTITSGWITKKDKINESIIEKNKIIQKNIKVINTQSDILKDKIEIPKNKRIRRITAELITKKTEENEVLINEIAKLLKEKEEYENVIKILNSFLEI